MALLILDKSALRGCSRDSLRDNACRHTFLYTHALDYEIGTEHLSRGKAVPLHSYYDKLRDLTLHVSEPLFWLMTREEQARQPTHSIISVEATTRLRRVLERRQYGDGAREGYTPLARVFEEDIPCHVRGLLQKLSGGSFSAIFDHVRNDMINSHDTAACAYVRMISPYKAEELFAMAPNRPDAPPPYVLRKGWITYTYHRLLNYLCCWYCLNGQDARKALSDGNIANAYLDLHYLSLLDHADGVWSGDRHLIEMARAFFPDKTVLELPRRVPAPGHESPDVPRDGQA